MTEHNEFKKGEYKTREIEESKTKNVSACKKRGEKEREAHRVNNNGRTPCYVLRPPYTPSPSVFSLISPPDLLPSRPSHTRPSPSRTQRSSIIITYQRRHRVPGLVRFAAEYTSPQSPHCSPPWRIRHNFIAAPDTPFSVRSTEC